MVGYARLWTLTEGPQHIVTDGSVGTVSELKRDSLSKERNSSFGWCLFHPLRINGRVRAS
jgi:hypothetical protein